jgi:Type IV secretion-system coupling protein DNA-binding domain
MTGARPDLLYRHGLPAERELPALENLGSFAHHAAVLLSCFFAAAVLGAAAALLLRRRGLAWSWGAFPLLPAGPLLAMLRVGLLSPSEGAVPLALLLGAGVGALGWGIHARIEDRRAGGDRETAARARRGLGDQMWRALRLRRSGRLMGEGLPIGRTEKGELAMIGRGSSTSGRHVLIPGATGAGKTTSLAALLVDYVARSGFGAVVLEAKSDRTLRESAEGAAVAAGRRFHLLSPEGPASYDPLAHGSVDERSERLIAVESWGSSDADFYRQAASPFLRLVLRTLDQSTEAVTLSSVARHCEPDELENLALANGDPEGAEEVTATIRGLRSDQQRAIAGLRARLQNLASSEFARGWLDPRRPGAATFDLRRVIERREVAYFRFDTDRTGNVGRAIAQMVLLDLGAAASALMGEGIGTFVAIDEFGALEAPALERLYARGRAAGFSVAVGTQTLADLRAAGPAVRERVGATVSAVVCHRVGEQADAEWLAELIGAVPSWQSTIRTDRFGLPTAEGTRTRGYRFEVNPSELQRLECGEVYIARLDSAAKSRARRTRVVPPWLRLAQPRRGPSPPTDALPEAAGFGVQRRPARGRKRSSR